MIKISRIITFISIFISLNISAQVYHHTINWNDNQVSKPNDTGFLTFPNAIYDDHNTMVPSFFELYKIPSSISSLDELKITIESSNYIKLTDYERNKIKNIEKIALLKPYYSVQRSRRQNFLTTTIPAVRINSLGEPEKLVSFSIKVETKPIQIQKKQSTIKRSTKSSSLLSNGKWVKVNLKETGIYKISYTDLQNYGLSNLPNISIWGHGGKMLPYMNNVPSHDDLKQIPVFVETGADGIFNQGDYILFFAEGVVTWNFEEANNFFMHSIHAYSKNIHYFLTTEYSLPLRISDIQGTTTPSTYQTNAFDELVAFERNDTNLIKSGRDWLGEPFDIFTTQSFDTKLNNPEPGGITKLRIRVAARSSANSSFNLKVNNSNIGNIPINGIIIGDELADYYDDNLQSYSFVTPVGNTALTLTYNKPTSAALGWLDYISVNSRQLLNYQGKQLIFRDYKSKGMGKISQFNIQNAPNSLIIWDVTNIHYPRRITNAVSGGVGTFTLPTDSLRQFIAFETDKTLSVSFVGNVDNQNIHGLPSANMVIIAHPSLLSQAIQLADIHRTNDRLSVNVVTIDQVYNEFSSGNKDVSAIRNYMRMLHERPPSVDSLRYLLLFGDGTYNNISTSSKTNLIPTYQSPDSKSKTDSFVSDDFFGLLDSNEGEAIGGLDIGIGRFPVSTQEQANTVISKIRQYYSQSSLGDWNNQLCFIGDDEDGNIHMEQSDILADYVIDNHPIYNVQKTFFDAYLQQSTPTGNRYPDVNTAINNRINSGSLIVNYTGHGNEQWLSHEKVLMLDDVRSWQNFKKLPLFVTATCEFSRFDDDHLTSTGEMILLTPNGGGIGLLSTTRLVWAAPNFTLNEQFIHTVFAQRTTAKEYLSGNGDRYYRLGDIVRITKDKSGTGNNKRNFMLLGDPALMLKYPNLGISVTHINNIPFATFTDTIKALSKLKINGKITNPDGTDANDYNGNVSIVLFDKENMVKTLNNDGESFIMDFMVRENVVYKGSATAQSGLFSINSIIPKDINYKVGTGRISFFSTNGIESGAGFNQAILIGDVSSNSIQDNIGPTIKVYLNDNKFVSGGISNSNPKLIVHLTDSSGINTTGTGIGHDLVATISGENEKSIILNNFYSADKDSYKSGKAELQLSGLSMGQNKIKVKAWDAFNNSSESEISFIVSNDNKLEISHLLNYPNPFTENTSFYFEHNLPFANFEILIQIYSVSGKLVKTIKYQEFSASGYRIGPIRWDGKDDFGDKIGRGVYFYRIRVRDSNGKSAEQQQKLVVLK